MDPSSLQKIVCIFPRLGANVGGGKIAAVFQRMNLMAGRDQTEVVLLNLQHSAQQKVTFAQLQAAGILDPRIRHASIYEFCTPPKPAAPDNQGFDLPAWDQQIAKAGRKRRVSYFDGDTPVMRDTFEDTVAGRITIRQLLTCPDTDIRLKYVNHVLVERLIRSGDEVVRKTYYANGRAVVETCHENKVFQSAKSFVTGGTYDTETALHKALVAKAFPSDCLVFIDGITTAHLSPHIAAQKVLFLHADHRASDGTIVPRSRYLIDHFEGAAIATATHVHKTQLQTDTRPSAPIRVIPHYTDHRIVPPQPRRHICTVSRLELIGKPIHHCIEAFTRIMHLIPDVNYLIYGSGLGEARLRQLITHHGCEDRVFLMGHSSDTAVVFAQSILSLAPTMTEGFGLSLLESLTQGCPVITYDVDYGPRELVQPGENGERVTPGDIETLAHAILKVYENAQTYSENSRRSVERYSFESYRSTYFRLIDDLVGRDRFFDISAPDLKIETRAAFDVAAQKHKARLLDLYIKLCEDNRDIAGTYWGFQQKLALFPSMQRPLMRCIWLSRRLGLIKECAAYLALFAQRFPKQHDDFVSRYPDFLTVTDADS
jgi:glycosyltransferase involved in cell wall biosynthesis